MPDLPITHAAMPLLLQLLRLHLGVPRVAIARQLALCPCCYRAYELGESALTPTVYERLVSVWPFLPLALDDSPTEIRLPPFVRQLKNRLERLRSLQGEQAAMERGRVRLALQWLDDAATRQQVSE